MIPGTPLRLAIQLFNGNADIFVRAYISNGNEVIGQVNLESVGNGVYIDNTFLATNVPQLYATYIVYADSGYTIQDISYCYAFDVFTQPGSTARLVLQLFDGNQSQFVKAFVRDATGAEITTVELTSAGNGLYVNPSYEMPNTPEIYVTYIIYSDSGYSTENTTYSYGFDTFLFGVGTYPPQLEFFDVEYTQPPVVGIQIVAEVEAAQMLGLQVTSPEEKAAQLLGLQVITDELPAQLLGLQIIGSRPS